MYSKLGKGEKLHITICLALVACLHHDGDLYTIHILQCGISYTTRGKSGKGEHTTFTLPEEQHLNAGPLVMVGGAVLLELFVNLITNVLGLCFFVEVDIVCIGGFI